MLTWGEFRSVRPRWAGWAGSLPGLVALLPGAYRVWGSMVVYQDWSECANRRVALLANTHPVGYCEFTDWVRQFGIGIALISTGVLGLITVFVVLRHAPYFQSPAASATS